jgi:hypothetical protein
MLKKPEALKSNNPGYIRGRKTIFFSTPEWVERVFIDINNFNTSGVGQY